MGAFYICASCIMLLSGSVSIQEWDYNNLESVKNPYYFKVNSGAYITKTFKDDDYI